MADWPVLCLCYECLQNLISKKSCRSYYLWCIFYALIRGYTMLTFVIKRSNSITPWLYNTWIWFKKKNLSYIKIALLVIWLWDGSALRARLQLLRQFALSLRQIGVHLWHWGRIVSRQTVDIGPLSYKTCGKIAVLMTS